MLREVQVVIPNRREDVDVERHGVAHNTGCVRSSSGDLEHLASLNGEALPIDVEFHSPLEDKRRLIEGVRMRRLVRVMGL
jgi:hypothetical protein